jgi:hypothetical protein
MDEETLNALKGSIKKHENIFAGIEVDHGTVNCPLCQLFRLNDCKGCPVSEKTGEKGCLNTPYEMWSDHQDEEHDNGASVRCPECARLVGLEIEFLKSLIPTTI